MLKSFIDQKQSKNSLKTQLCSWQHPGKVFEPKGIYLATKKKNEYFRKAKNISAQRKELELQWLHTEFRIQNYYHLLSVKCCSLYS